MGAVELVEVDVVGLEAAEAGFALLDDVAAAVAAGVGVFRIHGAVHLGREDDLVATTVPLERLARDLLALAEGVDVGGVEEVDAGVEGAVDNRVRLFGLGTPAEHHAAEAEARDLHTRAAKVP